MAENLQAGFRLGNTGLQQFGGRVVEEFHRQLRGEQGIRVFREMTDNDSVISGILLLIEYLLRQVEIGVEPAGSSSEQIEAAEFLDSCIKDLGTGGGTSAPGSTSGSASSAALSGFLSEFISTLTFGWSYFEEIYKLRHGDGGEGGSSRYNDGRLGWADFEIRSQDTLWRWEIDEKQGNRILGLWQQSLPTWTPTFIPIEKAVLFRTRQHKNNPEGRSYLRGVYRSWYLKKRMEEIEAIGIERDLVGLPYMTVPRRLLEPGATPEDTALVEQFKRFAAEVRRDEREGLVLPAEKETDASGTVVETGYKFGLMASGGTRAVNTNEIITRYDDRIARGLLHHFFLLGSGPTGSRALSSDLTDLSALAVGSILDIFVDTLNAQAVPRLYRRNGFPPETWATIRHGDIEKQELDKIASLLSVSVPAGVVTPDEGLERHVRDLMGAPQLGESLASDPGTPDAQIPPEPAAPQETNDVRPTVP